MCICIYTYTHTCLIAYISLKYAGLSKWETGYDHAVRSVCVCIRTYLHIYIYIYTYIHTHIHTDTYVAASDGSNSHQNGTRMPQEGLSGPAVLASSMLPMHDSTQSSGTAMLLRNTVARILVDSHTSTYDSHAQYV